MYKWIHPKGNQCWIIMGRTDAEAEVSILWPSDAKNWLIWKDPDAGKDWGQEEKGATEDEMVGWHHQVNGHGFWWTPGVGDGQGGLACFNSWGCKESDTTELLNWSEEWKYWVISLCNCHIIRVIKNPSANAGDMEMHNNMYWDYLLITSTDLG